MNNEPDTPSEITLKRIIEESDTAAGRTFDLSVQCLIVISTVTFAVETLPGLTSRAHELLRMVEVISVAVFTVEYLLRLLVADRRLQYAFSFYGLVDLIAVLPFYLQLGVDLRAVRILRLLRLFRIIKMARYNRAIERFRRAFLDIREELTIYLGAVGILIFLASVGIYYCESEAQPDRFPSVFHALWWSVVTLTTVGYGDVFPITVGGRVFTGLLLLLGVGVVSVPSGLFAAALATTKSEEP